MRCWGHRGAGEEGWLGPWPDPSALLPDLRLINTQAIFAKRTGMIILGGGVVKHHIANANLMVSGPRAWALGRAALGLARHTGRSPRPVPRAREAAVDQTGHNPCPPRLRFSSGRWAGDQCHARQVAVTAMGKTEG